MMSYATVSFAGVNQSFEIRIPSLSSGIPVHIRPETTGLPFGLDVAMTIIVVGVLVFCLVVYDMYRRYTKLVKGAG